MSAGFISLFSLKQTTATEIQIYVDSFKIFLKHLECIQQGAVKTFFSWQPYHFFDR